jgi:NAD+ synthase
MIVVNGSPYWRHKTGERLRLVRERAAQAGAPIVYVNQVGGQDELVFDGASFVMQPDGHVPVQCPAFARSYQSVDFKRISQGLTCQTTHHAALPQGDEADYAACVLGLRDYVTKSGFKSVILGLSGGIDSALCAAMAVDALGADKVQVLMLPYRYTSQESLDDAFACAKALGIDYHIVPIEQAVDGLSQTLRPFLKADPMGITAENLQSRARGTLLMAVSNTTGAMVITTGNKSEMAVGYATLYGDMNGGFNPIKDLYKMDVYALSALRNRWKPHDALGPDAVVIPERILTKAPSAELRDHQTDQDSLPPYPVLDAVLKGLIEHEKSVADLVHEGFDETIVMRVLHLLHCAEYKRRQSAPGVKITRKNFGRDRRYPITQRFHQ